VVLAGAGLALVLVVAGIAYWLHARSAVSTDDAFIEARVIHISPKVGGQVVEVNVTDNQRVRPGDVLVRIDPRDYDATVQQARAQVRAAEGPDMVAPPPNARHAPGNPGRSSVMRV